MFRTRILTRDGQHRRTAAGHATRLAFLSIFMLIGCVDDQPTPAEPTFNAGVDKSSPNANLQPASIRADEALYSELGRTARSAAGFFLDGNGNLVVLVRDASDNANARVAMQSMLSRGAISALKNRQPAIMIRAAQYSFGQLASWRDALFDHLSRISGVTSLDLDEVQNRVTVGIDPNSAAPARAAVLSLANSLAVDTAAVAFRLHGPLKPRASSSAATSMYSIQINQHWDTLADVTPES